MNKQISKILTMLVIACICVTTVGAEASASAYKMFMYKKGVKVYREASLTKGKKQYQIVKMTSKRIVVRPQKGYFDSADPYFLKKKITLKLSKKCRFYYTDVLFPLDGEKRKYRRVSKKSVKKYMKELKIYYSQIENVGKYYNGGYAGEIYMKNGKVVAVLSNGGD